MAGELFVVGTPIGNLGDFSPRAVETLLNVDFIAAEDTRVTIKLLNYFEIKNKLGVEYVDSKNDNSFRIITIKDVIEDKYDESGKIFYFL